MGNAETGGRAMTWIIRENPAYKGVTPRKLTPACHDRSPMVDIECSFCGDMNHLHESQLDLPQEITELALRCARCGLPNVGSVEMFRDAFAQLRADGWIE